MKHIGVEKILMLITAATLALASPLVAQTRFSFGGYVKMDVLSSPAFSSAQRDATQYVGSHPVLDTAA